MEASSFKITMPVFKAYTDPATGDKYIIGLGGDTQADYDPKLDKNGMQIGYERLSLACIMDMKSQIRSGKVILVPSHWYPGPKDSSNVNRDKNSVEWNENLGEVTDAEITPTGQIFPKIKLDPHNPQSQYLYYQIVNKGKKLGLSWGGLPMAAHKEYDSKGNEVRVFDKIDLWHFMPTTKPVVKRSLNYPLEVAAKSISWETAAFTETKVAALEDYPDREAVEAIYKSLAGSDGNDNGDGAANSDPANAAAAAAPEIAVKTNIQEETSMTPEEIKKAIQDGIQEGLKAQKDADEATKNAALKASESDKLIQEKIKEGIAEALKAQPAAKSEEKPAEKLDVAALKTELLDAVAQKINEALAPLAAGLKSGKDGAGDPGKGDVESEALKAFTELKLGRKALSDFPQDVQAKIVNLGNVAFQETLKSMPEVGGF